MAPFVPSWQLLVIFDEHDVAGMQASRLMDGFYHFFRTLNLQFYWIGRIQATD
jgi:hypothetical protein